MTVGDHIFDLGVSIKMFKIPIIMLRIYQIQKTLILRQLLPSGTDLEWRCSVILLKLVTQRETIGAKKQKGVSWGNSFIILAGQRGTAETNNRNNYYY